MSGAHIFDIDVGEVTEVSLALKDRCPDHDNRRDMPLNSVHVMLLVNAPLRDWFHE